VFVDHEVADYDKEWRRSKEPWMIFRTSLIGLLVLCAIGTAVAEPAGPPAGYKIDPEFTRTSPDGVITIEQYLNKDTEDYKWQFWVRREWTFTLLDPEPDSSVGSAPRDRNDGNRRRALEGQCRGCPRAQ
jgi:hypothetical protein